MQARQSARRAGGMQGLLFKGVVASFCIEMVQGAFLPRTSSLLDWIANSLGALLGVVVVLLLERFRPAPSVVQSRP